MAIGVDEAGNRERTGGWGRALDDEGSAFDLGRKALASAMKSLDGRGSHSSLAQRALRHFGATDADGLVLASTAPGFEPKVAEFAPLVIEAAREGDVAATRVVRKAARDLAEMVSGVARKLGLEGFPLVLVGGTFTDATFVLPLLTEELTRLGHGYQVREPLLPPVGGAVLRALGGAGEIHGDLVDNLSRDLKERGISSA
jgi:N-acetylglucosamine kinase-like BadF-type ATPase